MAKQFGTSVAPVALTRSLLGENSGAFTANAQLSRVVAY
jgi:hypothetical protein